MIDLLNLQPTTISKDLSGKYILLYGQPKCGKTTFAASFPKNLLCAFEKGYNALYGVYAEPILRWSDFKLLIRQLEKPAVREKFDTITIDTVSIAYQLCESFICSQNNVQAIGDIPWGKGYKLLVDEFETTLRKITMLGYGIILISHSEERKFVDDKDNEIYSYAPALDKRCYAICNRLVDIIGYIGQEWDEHANAHRFLYTRQTPQIVAGSRYKYLAPKIKFGYAELTDAIADALEKQAELDNAHIVDHVEQKVEKALSYDELRHEAETLWNKLITNTDGTINEEMVARIRKRIEMIFGHPMKLSEITEDQVDLYELVIADMKELAEK